MSVMLQMTSFSYLLSIIVFVVMASRLVIRDRGYDERQVLVKARAYKYSLLLIWGLCLLFSFLDLPRYIIVQVLFFASFGLHFSYRIWHHSLAPLGKTGLGLLVSSSFTLITLALHAVAGLQEGRLVQQDWLLIVVMAGSFGAIVISLLYRRHLDGQEEY